MTAPAERAANSARPISGVYKDNLIEMIYRLAGAGRDDPTIAHRLGITASQVRRLRKEADIPAGERRWLPIRTPAPDQAR